MEEGQGKNKISNKLPSWMKNPYIIAGVIVVLVIVIYFLMPIFRTLESPFTQYNPLPIDSTYIKLDTVDSENPIDSSSIKMDTIVSVPDEDPKTSTDTSSITNLFRLNTDYHELDPNEQVNRDIKEDAVDLFSQLILADLEASDVDKLEDMNLSFGIKPVLHILSSTAVDMLTSVQTKYHMDILEAMEQSYIVQGVMIMDKGEKVVYATNRKFKNQYLFELFPRRSLTGEKLIILGIEELQFISMPVHHQYGKIGTIILILEE